MLQIAVIDHFLTSTFTNKTLDKNAENKHLEGVFVMSIFLFGILRDTWLLVYVRIRIFFSFHNLVTVTAK